MKPIAIYLVNKVYREVTREAGIPLMGLGGIRTAADAIEFMMAGATTVAVGTASFVEPDTAAAIVDGLRDFCSRKRIVKLSELTGSLDEPT